MRHHGDADYFAFEGLVVIYLSYGRNLLGFSRITRMPEAGDAVKVAPTIGAKAENNPPPKLVAWVLSRATNQNALATPFRGR